MILREFSGIKLDKKESSDIIIKHALCVEKVVMWEDL